MKRFIPSEVLALAEHEARLNYCLATFRRDPICRRDMIRRAERTIAALKRAGFRIVPEPPHGR